MYWSRSFSGRSGRWRRWRRCWCGGWTLDRVGAAEMGSGISLIRLKEMALRATTTLLALFLSLVATEARGQPTPSQTGMIAQSELGRALAKSHDKETLRVRV